MNRSRFTTKTPAETIHAVAEPVLPEAGQPDSEPDPGPEPEAEAAPELPADASAAPAEFDFPTIMHGNLA